MIVSIVYIGVVVYFFVRWIWAVAEIRIGLPLPDYLRLLRRVVSWMLLIPIAIAGLGIVAANVFDIDYALAVSGGLLLFMWMITSVALIHWKMLHEERRGARAWGE